MLDGDADLCDGVRVLLTPGHTPGHQAVVINSLGETLVIAAQCIFRRDAWIGEIEVATFTAPIGGTRRRTASRDSER